MFEEAPQLFCQDLYLLSHVAGEAEVSRAGRWGGWWGGDMSADCFLYRCCVCSGVHYHNWTLVGLRGPGCCGNGRVVLTATSRAASERDLCRNTENSPERSGRPLLPASGPQRRWFILLRQWAALTHTHTRGDTQTHIQESAEVCCHTPLINSYLSAGSPYRIGPLKGDSFPMTDKGSLGDTEDP